MIPSPQNIQNGAERFPKVSNGAKREPMNSPNTLCGTEATKGGKGVGGTRDHSGIFSYEPKPPIKWPDAGGCPN